MYLSSSNANDNDITHEKNRYSKTEITIRYDRSDKRKDSVHVEEVVHNEPGSDQVSNKNMNNSSNNLVFFGDSISKIINVKNLKSRLYSANCNYCFFDGATSKDFRHYIRQTLNETDVITNIAVLHKRTNDITNSEVNKDLAADSIINIARECVGFGVKSVLFQA